MTITHPSELDWQPGPLPPPENMLPECRVVFWGPFEVGTAHVGLDESGKCWHDVSGYLVGRVLYWAWLDMGVWEPHAERFVRRDAT